jgi:hypothetical protein
MIASFISNIIHLILMVNFGSCHNLFIAYIYIHIHIHIYIYIYIYIYIAAIFGQQGFFLFPHCFEALITIYWLVLGRSNVVLQVHYLGNHLPPHKNLSQASFPSLNLTYRGTL